MLERRYLWRRVSPLQAGRQREPSWEQRRIKKNTVQEAKEVFKSGDKEKAATSLQEAADLLKELIEVQTEILEQKQAISEIIQ